MLFTSDLEPKSPWLWYQRSLDAAKVRGRIVERSGKKYMEVEESLGGEVHCPNCKFLLETSNDWESHAFLLEISVFHERHRPLDKPPLQA